MIRIEVLNGLEQGRVIELAPGTWVFGRRDGVDYKIIGDAVSGRHLEVEVISAGEVHFKDLKSTNGTWSGGLKVEEGEWFAGTELRVGNLNLKLLASDQQPGAQPGQGAPNSSASAVANSDADIHSRAVEEALSSKSRSGPLMMVLLLVMICGAVGAWFVFGGTPEFDEESIANNPRSELGPNSRGFDAIDNLGVFDEDSVESWQLSSGLSIVGDSIRSSGGRQSAKLLPTFEQTLCAVEISAAIQGDLKVWPEIEWGSGESTIGTWAAPQLGKQAVTLQLPCDQSEWFRVSLRLAGSGSISELNVEARDSDGVEVQSVDGGRRLLSAQANMQLFDLNGPILNARGAGGEWKAFPGGVEFSSQQAWLEMDFLAAQVIILTDGDPLSASKGVEVADANGLILRGERPTLFEFTTPQNIKVAANGILSLESNEGLKVDWDLTEALTNAAQLNLNIKRFARQKDTAQLLNAVQELVQKYPLNEDEVEHAEQLRAAAIAVGRESLNQIERQVAEAMFLGAANEMQRVGTDALALAASLPGTNLAIDAQAISDLLDAESERVLADSRAAADEYRQRLLGALERSYPVMAAWIDGGQQ